MKRTKEELQAALDALEELEDNEYWRRGDYSENHKIIRAVLEEAISKMETTEKSSEVAYTCGSPDFPDQFEVHEDGTIVDTAKADRQPRPHHPAEGLEFDRDEEKF